MPVEANGARRDRRRPHAFRRAPVRHCNLACGPHWRPSMPIESLRAFLDRNRIKYVLVTHSPAHTAQEIAASAHIPGRAMAKTVIVKLDGRLAMAVLPASEMVDLELLADAAFAQKAELADEAEFADRFPDCQLGAMPPF